ncbi:MAG TPA: Ldh family oxidoreductase [Caldilineaceae bacterium]|nr:Ldh family oxidoreductase [Caldilineaceae bacterium]
MAEEGTEAEGEERVPAEALLEAVQAIFERCGMPTGKAFLLADSLVYADLRGIHSHGVLRVPEYVQKLTTGGVDPQGQPFIARERGACLVVDGSNSMGQIGAHFAMEHVIARARLYGIAAAAIRGSNHCGAMAYFAIQALPHDMIGIATTNALPTMAPWGGTDKLLGINPLGVAIPAGEEPPIVYDAAFSGSSHGKIRIHHQKGLPLPEGWALDKEGRPTTDPAAALEGLLMPIGGFKGVGLALIMGILSSMLSGAAYGVELGSMEEGPRPGMDGHFVAAIQVGAFEDVRRFKARVDKAIRQLRQAHKAPGVTRIYAPGELEHERAQTSRARGIPLNPVTLADLRRTAAAVGVNTPWLARA